MKLSPQAKIVLKHLLSVGSITAVEASAVHRIRSLSRRVTELDQVGGYLIQKEHKRDVVGQRYVKYSVNKDIYKRCDCAACTEARA